MVNINLPPRYFHKRAIFKRTAISEGQAGEPKRFTIPKTEAEVLGLQAGDEVDVSVYDPVNDVVSREDRIVRGQETSLNITIKKSVRPEGGFTKDVPSQLILFKPEDVGFLGEIFKVSPENFYNRMYFKSKSKLRGTSLRINIPKEENTTLDVGADDMLNVLLIELFGDSNVPLRKRSVFRVTPFERSDSPRELTFTIPKPRVESKGYSAESIFQVIAWKA